MGWTSFTPSVPRQTTAEILSAEFGSAILLKHATIGGTFYAAASSKSEPETVFGLVVLVERRGGHFAYKDMDEGMGPYESQCPLEILDMLSPTASESANRWRERCRVNAGQPAATAPRLLAGERQGDLITSTQTEDFALITETAIDGAAVVAAREEKTAADANTLAQNLTLEFA